MFSGYTGDAITDGCDRDLRGHFLCDLYRFRSMSRLQGLFALQALREG